MLAGLALLLVLAPPGAAGSPGWRLRAEPGDSAESALSAAARREGTGAVEALAAVSRQFPGTPASGLARLAAGLRLLDEGRPADAIPHLAHEDVQLTLVPDHALFALGRAHEALGQADAAARAYLAAAGSGAGGALRRSRRLSRRDVQRMVATAVDTYGRLDILFNNAAVQVFGTIPETSTSDWHKVLDVNLKGVYLGCKYAIPQMIAQGGGCFANMSSTLGFVGDPMMPAYGATKGGILAMTKAMAQAHGRQNVRVNCICPGDVDTPIVQEYFDQQPDPAAARRQVAGHYALGRIAQPEEIAQVALFLACDESSFLTDTAIVADGGLTSRCY